MTERKRRKLRVGPVAGVLGSLLALGTSALAFGVVRMRRSRPLLDGVLSADALQESVLLERDERGVPTLRASSREDAAFALGFVHAQERFYQMDVSRRAGAGELAELFGKEALTFDRMLRPHDCKARAQAAVDALPARQRRLLAAYTAGVNRGLNALAAPPFEYAVLRSGPRAWREEDSLLVTYSFYMLLQLNLIETEYQHGLLRETFAEEVADFLAPLGTEWDAPLIGAPFASAAIPGPDELDLRRVATTHASWSSDQSYRVRGSNSWALAPAHTATGKAMLANDMHLGLSVPNTFYRASLRYREQGNDVAVDGVTAPGVPLILAGSNGKIAWGLTNAPADWLDLIRLDQRDLPEHQYHGPNGVEALVREDVQLAVGGSQPESLRIERSGFGPVVKQSNGVRYAAQWVAHSSRAVDLTLADLATASSTHEAIAIAQRSGIPQQNFVAVDAAGSIGWTIVGPVPRRSSSQRSPRSSREHDARWDGWLAPEEVPALLDPPQGRLWTANGRTVDGDALTKLGHGYYLLGARGGQIRDRLRALDGAQEADMLALQYDDEARFLARWQQLALRTLAELDHPLTARARSLIEAWGQRASTDSAGYRLVREFRDQVEQLTFAPFVALARARHPDFELDPLGDQREGPLWALHSSEPAHLLAPEFASWSELRCRALREVLVEAQRSAGSLDAYTWGRKNVLSMRHSFSKIIPWLSALLDMPAAPLAGDFHMPLAQLGDHGAVMRMVVTPGDEARGVMQMPGGQASHPWSPYFGAGHQAWLHAEPTPFLPGPTKFSLTLQPGAADD